MDFKLSCTEQMSDAENPASFGMAANVDRSLQRTNSAQVISNLRTLKTAISGGGDHGGGGGGAATVSAKLWEEHLSPLWQYWESTR